MDNANSQNLKRVKAALILVITVLLVLAAARFLEARKFHVVSTNPGINRISNATPVFKVNFSRTLDSKSPKITSAPDIINSYTVSNKTLSISLKPLSVNKTYSITINSVNSTNHATITNKVLTFTAKYIDPSNLPQDQQQAILRNQQNYSSPANDPIVAHLPYQTLNFSLSAQVITDSNNKPALVLRALLILNQADMSNQAAAVAQDKQMVLSYIQSLGLDPSKYTIEYNISTP